MKRDSPGECISKVTGDNLCQSILTLKILIGICTAAALLLLTFRKRIAKYLRLLTLLLLAGLTACNQADREGIVEQSTAAFPTLSSPAFPITWVEHIQGDFSFKDHWSYPEGVYKNEFGQLSCDGICPPAIDRMLDENGKILQDSLSIFYQWIDTTHISHSLQSEALTYEWAGADFINFSEFSGNLITGETVSNVSTHSSLHFELQNKYFTAWINYTSINAGSGPHIFPIKSGKLTIDKTLFKQGIVKAEFNLKFTNTTDAQKPIYWKGKIYNIIQKDE